MRHSLVISAWIINAIKINELKQKHGIYLTKQTESGKMSKGFYRALKISKHYSRHWAYLHHPKSFQLVFESDAAVVPRVCYTLLTWVITFAMMMTSSYQVQCISAQPKSLCYISLRVLWGVTADWLRGTGPFICFSGKDKFKACPVVVSSTCHVSPCWSRVSLDDVSGILMFLLSSRTCRKRGWQRSTLIMSVPQTSASKGKVMLKEYNGRRIETEQIFRWMTSHVAHRIKTLCRSEKLLEEWQHDPSHPIKMFLFARLSQPPAFFSSLSVKFTGRIEFIFVDIRNWDNHSSLSEIGVSQSPAYILKMPEGIYRYGNRWWLNVELIDILLFILRPG